MGVHFVVIAVEKGTQMLLKDKLIDQDSLNLKKLEEESMDKRVDALEQSLDTLTTRYGLLVGRIILCVVCTSPVHYDIMLGLSRGATHRKHTAHFCMSILGS